jgi:hypothetical protein
MALVCVIGVTTVLLAVVIDSSALALLGSAFVVLAALGFLVPGFRDRRPVQRVDRESYFGFVLNLFRTTHPPAERAARRHDGAAPLSRTSGDESRADRPTDSP